MNALFDIFWPFSQQNRQFLLVQAERYVCKSANFTLHHTVMLQASGVQFQRWSMLPFLEEFYSLSGDKSTNFKPNQTVIPEESAQILVRLLGQIPPE